MTRPDERDYAGRSQRRILNLVERVMRAIEAALRLLDLRGIAFRFGLLEIGRALIDAGLRLLQSHLAFLLESVIAAMGDLGAGTLERRKKASLAVSLRLRDLGVDPARFRSTPVQLFARCSGVDKLHARGGGGKD